MDLTPEEIQAIPKMAQAAIADWQLKIKTATIPQEYEAYAERVNEITSGVEGIKDERDNWYADELAKKKREQALLKSSVKDLEREQDREIFALMALIRELKRHRDMARDRARNLRRQQPHGT